jgi:hypothetical protein
MMSISFAEMIRAVTSVEPPGPKATINLIGCCEGHLAFARWANANEGTPIEAPKEIPDAIKVLRSIVVSCFIV